MNEIFEMNDVMKKINLRMACVAMFCAAFSCVMVACGGGETSLGEPDVWLQPHPVASTSGPMAAMAVPAARMAGSARTPDASSFLNWAESAYPNLFETRRSNQFLDVWTYRYYPKTDIYLGVNTSGDVLGLVGKGGGAYDSFPLGQISAFGCSVYPSDCAPVVGAQPIELNVNGELADSAVLPSPPSNIRPLSEIHNPAVEPELAVGAYKFGQTRVMMFGGATSDCPNMGTTTCPYFSRVRMDSTGKFSIDSYAYFPTSNKWIALQATDDFKIGSGDLYGTSDAWSSVPFSPTTAAPSLQNNRRVYLYGSAAFQLGINATSIAGTTVLASAPAAGTYSQSAKSYMLNFELLKGQYVTLKKGGFWSANGTADDANSYSRLADLRKAHTSTSTPLCLDDVLDPGKGVVFNESVLAATVHTIVVVCKPTITAQAAYKVAEGVTTVANRKLILLQQPDPNAAENTSSQQFVMALGLTDAGIGARGKAYQPGFIQSKSGYFNEAAFIDWMTAQYTGTVANSFPK